MARNKSEKKANVHLVFRNLTFYFLHLNGPNVTISPRGEVVANRLSLFSEMVNDPQIFDLLASSKLELAFKGTNGPEQV